MSPLSLCFQILSGKLGTQMCQYELEPEPAVGASCGPFQPWLLSEGEAGVAHLSEIPWVDGVSFGHTLGEGW